MNKINKISMTSVNIGDLFKNEIDFNGDTDLNNIFDRKNSPDWVLSRGQRLYSWGDKQIQDLVNDILYIKNELPEDHQYLLQSITIAKDYDKNTIKVLDGQQRLTTLWLLKLALVISILSKNPIRKQIDKGPKRQENSNIEKKEENEAYKKVLELLKNDIEERYYRNNSEDLDSESEEIQKRVKNDIYEDFEKYIYKQKIKLNVFLPQHQEIFNNLKNNSEFLNFINIISEIPFENKEKLKNVIYKFFLCKDGKEINVYLENMAKNLCTLLRLIKKTELSIEEISNIVDNRIVIGVTYIGEPKNQLIEVKSFTNINSRGLQLDFISQFKPWYFEQIMISFEELNKDKNLNTEVFEKLLSNIEEKFENWFTEYDISYNKKMYKQISSIYENFVNKSLIDALNIFHFKGKFVTKKFSRDGEEKYDLEMSPFNYKDSWINFMNKYLQESEDEEKKGEDNKKIFKTLFINDIKKSIKNSELPEFINIFDKMLSGRKKYLDILISDINNSTDDLYQKDNYNSKYFTRYDQRFLPLISLICAEEKDESNRNKKLRDILAYQTVINLNGKPIANFQNTQNLYKPLNLNIGENGKLENRKEGYLDWKEWNNKISNKVLEEIARTILHPNFEKDIIKNSNIDSNKIRWYDYARFINWLYDEKDKKTILTKKQELHHIVPNKIKKIRNSEIKRKYNEFCNFFENIQLIHTNVNNNLSDNIDNKRWEIASKLYMPSTEDYIKELKLKEEEKKISNNFEKLNKIFDSLIESEKELTEENSAKIDNLRKEIREYKLNLIKDLVKKKIK